MKTPSLSIPQITNSLSHFLHRYHLILFALLALGGLSVTTFMLYQSITAKPATSNISTSTSQFDKTTIEKIKTLRDPDEPSEPLSLPPGRTNPFQ